MFIANQGFTLETAQAEIAAGNADAVAWGQLFIANPDLPARLRRGGPLNTPDASTFYASPGSDPVKGYTDYPALP